MTREGAQGKGISRRNFVKGLGAGMLLGLGDGITPRRASAKLIGSVPAWKYIWSTVTHLQAIDPHVFADLPAFTYKLNMYGELYRYQDTPPKIIPWIARSHEVSPDATKWTFHLYRGQKFHDDTEITAEDVRFSLERLMEMGKDASSGFRPYMRKDAVKVIDPYTCQFNLQRPVGFFMTLIPLLSIVNSKLLRKHDKSGDYGVAWLANNEAGSGAFRLKEWDPPVGFKAEQWPEWKDGWRGKHFKEIEYRTIIEVASRVNALRIGEIHGVETYLPPDQIEKLKKNPEVKVIPIVGLRTFLVRMNCQRPPTSNVHFRRALSYAFPYKEYIEKAMLGNAVQSLGGPIPNNMWGWPKDLKVYDTDLKKAKEELAIAKKELSAEDFNRPVTIKAVSGLTNTKIAALYLQSAASELGLEMKVQEGPWAVLVSATRDLKTTHDIWIHWMSAYYLDPDNWVGRPYSSSYHGSMFGSTYYSNEKADKLLEKARITVNKEERKAIYEEATRLIVADAPDIWVSNDKWNGTFTADVQGWRFCDIGVGQEIYPMWRE